TACEYRVFRAYLGQLVSGLLEAIGEEVSHCHQLDAFAGAKTIAGSARAASTAAHEPHAYHVGARRVCTKRKSESGSGQRCSLHECSARYCSSPAIDHRDILTMKVRAREPA